MHTTFQRMGVAGVLLTALLTAGTGVAKAAPQALALVATNGTVQLACEGGDCSAELTSFCLQSDRFSPTPGTTYNVVDTQAIQLLGTTDDGRTVSLDPAEYLRVESARTHVAVRVSVSQQDLDALDMSKVEIAVGSNVSLLPAPEPGDDNPITEGEIAVLTGPLRALGSRVVDGNGDRMQAARITSRMINLLPRQGAGGDAIAAEAWRRSIGAVEPGSVSPGAQKLAKGAFAFCRFAVNQRASASMRGCLQTEHDGLVNFLNSEYWDATAPGS